MGELLSRLRYHFGFTKKECMELLVMSLIGGFIFSFRQWGSGTVPDYSLGLRNFMIAFFIVFLSMLIHFSVQRVSALREGYKAHFKTSYLSLFISIIITTVSNGMLPVFFPAKMTLSHIPRLRIGEYRYGVSYQDNGIIAAQGVYSHILLAFLFRILTGITGPTNVFDSVIFINVIIAVCTILPLPSVDGINLFRASRNGYAFLFSMLIAFAVLIFVFNIVWTIVIGFILGIIGFALYNTYVEQK